MDAPSNETKLMPISQLVEHPYQQHYYSADTAEADAIFEEDIRANGMRDAIHVVPPGNAAGLEPYTTLDGHRRLQAARKVGMTEVPVIIRWDLVAIDDDEMETVFLKFNLNRRQMTPLQRAYAAQRIYKIRQSKSSDHSTKGKKQLRDHIGALIGMSGRNLSRVMRVLRAPKWVQSAYDNGYIRLTNAEKIADLSNENKEALRAAVKEVGLEKAQEIVDGFVGTVEAKHKVPSTVFRAFIKSLERHLTDLGGRTNEVGRCEIYAHRAILRNGRKAIDCLLRRAKRPLTDKEIEKNIEREFRKVFGTDVPAQDTMSRRRR